MTNPAGLTTRHADLSRDDDRVAYLSLMDHFVADPQGGGSQWPDGVRDELVPAIRARSDMTIVIAWLAEEPVGLAACIEGFSTFQASAVLNLHDLMVHPEHRGRGIGRVLLAAVERHAREIGCCKLTLEVRANNHPARCLYQSVGFTGHDEGKQGDTLFWERPLRV